MSNFDPTKLSLEIKNYSNWDVSCFTLALLYDGELIDEVYVDDIFHAAEKMEE